MAKCASFTVFLFAYFAVAAPAAAQEEIRPVGKRIINCEPTKVENHPWQVAFNVTFPDGKTYLCGGSIIGNKWVLTAAHCFDSSSKPGDGRAKSGVTDIINMGNWAEIDRVIRHQAYNPKTNENDIALVKLKVPPNGKVIPPSAKDLNISVGQPLEVTGWGITEKGTTSETLCKTQVPYVDNTICNAKESYNGESRPGMMCAGYPKGGKDSCGGDSGGPLVWHGPDGAILVGVVSFGKGCALENKFGVYTRVSAYRDWIDPIVSADPN